MDISAETKGEILPRTRLERRAQHLKQLNLKMMSQRNKLGYQVTHGVQTTPKTNSQFLIKNILNLPNEEPAENAPFFSRGHRIEREMPLNSTRPIAPKAVKPFIARTLREDFAQFSAQMHFAPTQVRPSFLEDLLSSGDLMKFPVLSPFQNGFIGGCLTSGFGPPSLRPLRPTRCMRRPKIRPLFSHKQLSRLESEFMEEKYLTESKRTELSMDLEMTETQVKTWFQNRRTKWRKETKEENSTYSCALKEKQERNGIANKVGTAIWNPFAAHNLFDMNQRHLYKY